MIYFELFYTFFFIGLFTFGGGYAMIPMIQEQMVANNWMNVSELSDFIAISECTPGPFAINISTFVGSRLGGIFGSICATLGMILPSFIIIIIVAFILKKILKNRFVQGALNGVKPVVLALILYTAIVFFIRSILFNGGAIYSVGLSFDKQSFTLLIILFVFSYIYKKVKKKAFNPIMLLLMSALFGIILFI